MGRAIRLGTGPSGASSPEPVIIISNAANTIAVAIAMSGFLTFPLSVAAGVADVGS